MTGRIVSISAAPYDGYEFPAMLDSLAACGARHVEPAFIVGYTEPFDEGSFTDASARQHLSWLEASGLGCHAFSSHIDLGGGDAVAVFTRRMAFARTLGAKVINTNAAVRTRAAAFLANIEALARQAEAMDLVIGLENPGNGEDNVVNLAADGVALIADLGTPWVRLNYDPGNTASHRPGQVDAAVDAITALPACAHLHVKDVVRDASGWSFVPPGQGEIDYDAIMGAVASHAGLPLAVELPLRLRRTPDAQPVRARERVALEVIEANVRACLAFTSRWRPAMDAASPSRSAGAT